MKIFLLLLCALWSFPALAASLRIECPEAVDIGQPFAVRILSDTPTETVRVGWQQSDTVFSTRRSASFELLLGTDVLDAKPGSAELRVTTGQTVLSQIIRIRPYTFPEQRLTVAESMATPQPEVEERIAREQAQSREVLATVTDGELPELPLLRPVPGDVSSAYGLKRFFNGKPKNPHRGLDLRAALRDEAHATTSGRVALVAEQYYAGRCVFIDHGRGVYSVYMHLDEPLVRAGQTVRQGQPIGRVGQTGRVTGPHLHFGFYVLGKSVDPTYLFAPAIHY